MDIPLSILLADDDAADRLLFTEAFEQLKTRTVVRTVNNGTQLMDYLNKADTQLPHLLFLDLNMPRKNGIECLKEIKSNERLKDICIAIYSTSASDSDVEETFTGGANVYIKKPSNFEVLKKALSNIISETRIYQDPPFNKAMFMLRI